MPAPPLLREEPGRESDDAEAALEEEEEGGSQLGGVRRREGVRVARLLRRYAAPVTLAFALAAALGVACSRGGASSAGPAPASRAEAVELAEAPERRAIDGDEREILVTESDYSAPSESGSGDGQSEDAGSSDAEDMSQYYDCGVALDSWKESWPDEKKEFCCASEGKGCDGQDHITEVGIDGEFDMDDDHDDGPNYAAMDIPKNAWGTGWESLLINNILKPKDCARICVSNARCKSWAWKDEKGGICRLRHDAKLVGTKRTEGSSGIQEVGGMVTHSKTTTTTTATKTTTVSTTTTHVKGTSMFCWAVARPDTFEVYLLGMQRRKHTGLFECDWYSVYSNKLLPISPTFNSTLIDVDLNSKIGGEFNSPLNIDIFLTAWQKVFEEGAYEKYHWTVKVDVDAVFLPQRLRYVLLQHPDTHPRGLYFVNCKYGLHGPIEVLSRKAVGSLRGGWKVCKNSFAKMCKGSCQWGEDMFLDQCLKRVLKIERRTELTLLMEEHCNEGEIGRAHV